MPAGKPVVYNNVEFPSLTSVAEYAGVSYSSLYSSVRSGNTIEEAILSLKGSPCFVTPDSVKVFCKEKVILVYDDHAFTRITDIAKYLGVSLPTLRKFVDKYGNLADACDAIKANKESQCFYYDNQEFTSMGSLTEYLGVSNKTLSRYIASCGSLKAACDAIKSKWLVYNNMRFKSVRAVAKHIGISDTYLSQKMESGFTFEEACKLAERVVFLKNGSLGTAAQRSRLKSKLNGDMESVEHCLTCIFLDYPTKFGDTVYSSVESACSSLGDLSVKAVRARMLSKLLDFQEAVHELYFVVDGAVYKSLSDAAWVLKVSMGTARIICTGCSTNDERVARLREYSGSLTILGESLTLSRRGTDIAACVPCRDGNYIVYCRVCGRPLLLAKEEVQSFEHSNEFCSHHTQKVLQESGVSVNALRSRLRLLNWDFSKVLDFYTGKAVHGALYRISRLADVASAYTVCCGRYTSIVCAVCNKSVLLPTCDALSFKHSEKCLEYEWKE